MPVFGFFLSKILMVVHKVEEVKDSEIWMEIICACPLRLSQRCEGSNLTFVWLRTQKYSRRVH